MLGIDWIIKLGASQIDIIILIMGVGWTVYSFHQHRESKKKLTELHYKYNTLNTLVFHLCKKEQERTGVRLIKEGANSQGDFSVTHET
tara:strand:+ start:5360 stop:5623 length:264 start_codon:yes stop_codon:yes gene_type:complete